MPRPDQLLYPAFTPAPLRQATTVLFLRDTDQGLTVLMTRRSRQASFVPGSYVFPGGVIEAEDDQFHAQATRRHNQHAAQLTQAIAGIRESFEELGVLLAHRADGNMATQDDVSQLDRQQPLLAQCVAQGLTLAAADVYPLAHWIAPRDIPKRFDTFFTVARMPTGQIAVPDNAEQFEPVWVRPTEALQRHAQGDFPMIFPTVTTLKRLSTFASEDAVLGACKQSGPLWIAYPRMGTRNDKPQPFLPHHAPFGELALVCPDGQPIHCVDWQHETPAPLLKNLQRLTADNAGFMTGPGTNSYIVGDGQTGHIIIDPGPNDPAHLRRLAQAAQGDIRLIVCTHSHPDHSPGAKPLQAMCPNHPPVLGLPSQATSRADSRFVPDRALADDEKLTLSDGTTTHTLRVIHTPGHAANHLCLLLEEDGLLFSGDHILNGSTTIVAPPDGNMNDYMDSLDKLERLCAQANVEFIAPAHGYVLNEPIQVIQKLRAHRLAREAKAKQAMEAIPDGTLDDWLPLAYDDVPPTAWPAAKLTLQAHVERLQSMARPMDTHSKL